MTLILEGYYSLVPFENMVEKIEAEIDTLERHNDVLNDAIKCLMMLRAYLLQKNN